MMDLDSIIAAKGPQEQSCYILLDPTLREKRKRLEQELKQAKAYDAKHNERDTAPAVQKRIEEVDEEIADTRQRFVFRSIGRKSYGALLDEYKPRKGNEDDEEAGFNIDEFPPRLIALSSHDPKISLDQARKIWDEWSDAETTMLLGAAILANKEVVDVPFTNDGLPMGTRSIATPSATAMTEDSPTQSS